MHVTSHPPCLSLTCIANIDLDARRRQVTTATPGTCEWIWRSSFAEWLGDAVSKTFWISGKPGSGKSTLVKYLTASNETRSRLPRGGGSRWTIISHFFDFRKEKQVENSVGGLLVSLASQLVPDRFGMVQEQSLKLDTERLIEKLEAAFSQSIRKTLIFVDGLDEYAGTSKDMRDLCDIVLRLARHENTKMCSASRRETMIEHKFRDIPNLHISDYNSSGILTYIKQQLKELRQDTLGYQTIDLLRMQEILHQRAEGVFVWVYLALLEILDACIKGQSASEVMRLLYLLPAELEEMYHRIINRKSDSTKKEAAVLYHLLEDMQTYSITTNLLLAAYRFLALELGLSELPHDINSLTQFEARFNAIMGGLYELCTPGDTARGGDTSKVPKMIHETVRAFTNKTGWSDKWLLPGFSEKLPNMVWARLSCEALIRAGRYAGELETPRFVEALKTSCRDGYERDRLIGCPDINSFGSLVADTATGCNMIGWVPLLHSSMDAIFMHCENVVVEGDDEARELLKHAMPSKWVRQRLSFWQFDKHFQVLFKHSLHEHAFADLIQAAAHTACYYLISEVDRIRELSHSDRALLCTLLVQNYRLCPGRWKWGSKLRIQSELEILRSTVDEILVLDTQLSTFHLGLYLYLIYPQMPTFLRKHNRIEPPKEWSPWFTPDAVWQAAFGWPASTLLFLWPCSKYETFIGNDDFFFQEREQLHVLLYFGVDIHSQGPNGMNIVHYLISTHIIDHTYLAEDAICSPDSNSALSIEMLYWLEEAGADFAQTHNGKTPLQALKRGLNKIRRMQDSDPNELVYQVTEIVSTRFEQLEYILLHKQVTGHLPQPMMGTKYSGRDQLHVLKRYLEERCTVCRAT